MRYSEQVRHLESLLITAHVKGLFLRFPERFDSSPETSNAVNFHCKQLDSLGVNWRVQNTVLNVINNIDNQKYWDLLYKNDYRTLAENALKNECLNNELGAGK